MLAQAEIIREKSVKRAEGLYIREHIKNIYCDYKQLYLFLGIKNPIIKMHLNILHLIKFKINLFTLIVKFSILT